MQSARGVIERVGRAADARCNGRDPIPFTWQSFEEALREHAPLSVLWSLVRILASESDEDAAEKAMETDGGWGLGTKEGLLPSVTGGSLHICLWSVKGAAARMSPGTLDGGGGVNGRVRKKDGARAMA